MGLTLELVWFDKTSEELAGEEDSKDLGNDTELLTRLGLKPDEDINNGCFNVVTEWLPTLQPYFSHVIALQTYNYQIAFTMR
ncbi:cloacin immunity protein [Ectopseudomonas oleovorans]|uniref:Cloacin immunity protein n=1 Tax=Ectopseudomonas oleovorans TaxID=301 RepID=A0A397M3Z6_ECTOL|nr:colicin E3-like toxin immunity protein [Pseudomonas oleovorans]RIA19756.1 cloacin immunity protein [Pseudomonas oleovorans]